MTGSTDISACLPAPKGNYAPGTGNDGFIPCEGGTYQDEEGQGACKPCPPGYQCPAGSVTPTKCARGFFADMKQPWCKECAKGTYQDNEGPARVQALPRRQLLPGHQDGCPPPPAPPASSASSSPPSLPTTAPRAPST